MTLHLYKRWVARRADQEAAAKRRYCTLFKVSFAPFKIASIPTVRKEDLLYLRINYVDGSLTTSVEKKTP